MLALTILHRILSSSFPEIHAKRLTCLLAAVESVVTGSRLTLRDMGRGLHGQVTVKHNIKRIDRLLGNDSLHTEIPKLAVCGNFSAASGRGSPFHSLGRKVDSKCWD
jgi:hypothetical protein